VPQNPSQNANSSSSMRDFRKTLNICPSNPLINFSDENEMNRFGNG
jgi:hypothetical protein